MLIFIVILFVYFIRSQHEIMEISEIDEDAHESYQWKGQKPSSHRILFVLPSCVKLNTPVNDAQNWDEDTIHDENES